MKKHTKENLRHNDVIIVYENTAREYDNALLLKAELTRRRFNVEILHKNHFVCIKRREAIVLLPNSYHMDDLKAYAYSLNCNDGIYINLQYEQIFSERMRKIGYVYPKGMARDILQLCWGRDRYDQLAERGVNEDKLVVTGAIQLDFLRKEFDSFYLDRNGMVSRYGIDKGKRWLLYISSFTATNPASSKKNVPKQLYQDESFSKNARISIKTQKKTLEWFENAIREDPSLAVIYRRHPSEPDSKIIEEMARKYPDQFFDISELSVKQ